MRVHCIDEGPKVHDRQEDSLWYYIASVGLCFDNRVRSAMTILPNGARAEPMHIYSSLAATVE